MGVSRLAVLVLLVLACLPARALAQGAPRAPDASTRETVAVGHDFGTVTGIVVPNGAPTQFRFEYGTTEALGSVTEPGGAGAGAAQTVRATITGLPAVTRVFYRVVAANEHGERRGGVRSFVTQRRLDALTLGLRDPAGFGGSLRAAGRLFGAGVVGTPIALEFFHLGRWRQLGQTVQADGNGAFAFSYAPVLAPLRLRAITRSATPVSSPVRDLRVRPRVGISARLGDRGRRVFSGTVRPRLAGIRVSLQRRTTGGRWALVRRATTTAGARTQRYAFDVPARRGAYRVVAVVGRSGWSRGASRELAVGGERPSAR